MKVLILAPYPAGKAPNQRFRIEQYFDHLAEHGIDCVYRTFWSDAVWRIFYAPNHFFSKLFGLLDGLRRRLGLLFTLTKYDFVYIHRECLPIGPPVYEWLISRVFRKRMIYDFDDAIWIRNYSDANKGIARWLKSHQKVAAICRMSYKVTTGNAFLADYALKHNKNVEIIPTTIDTEHHHNRLKRAKNGHTPVIGWTGTHSTVKQLLQIEPQLAALQKKCEYELQVICDTDPEFTTVRYRFVPWKAESEIEDLMRFDIGIMPLKNTEWERGKCGFKALQYMALGIPTVASAVGANCDILQDDVNGILIPPEEPEAWVAALENLLSNPSLRDRLGNEGRSTIDRKYSVQSNKDNYIRLFS